MTHRAVFLDRDNTIIHNDGDLGDPDKVVLVQGAASAIASLRGLGYRIVVVTNQGGVARGHYTEADVEAVHQRIAELVQQTSGAVIDRFYYCPFHPEGTVKKYRREHEWRKPAPGMIQAAMRDMDLDAAGCWMVGDQLRDVEAGRVAGVRTVLLSDEKPAASGEGVQPDVVAGNLVEAVRIIAQHRRADRDVVAAHSGAESRVVYGPTKPTQPANAPTATPPPPKREPRKPTRPFKPWTIQPVVVPLEKQPSHTHPRTAESGAQAAEPAQPAAATDVQPADDADIERMETELAEQMEAVIGASAEQEQQEVQAKSESPPAVSEDTPVESASSDTQVELLRQILRQLKHRTAERGDFSFHKMLAGVFQMLAVGCVLFALFNYAAVGPFLQWMAGGMLSQLAVITLLILHSQE